MNILIESISENDFNVSPHQLFSDPETDRCFAKLKARRSAYAIAWRSDLLKPIIVEITPSIFAVGIDQNMAVVDDERKTVLLSLTLAFNLYNIQIVNDRLLVITELSIMEIDTIRWQVTHEYPLPDYFQEILTIDTQLKAKCVDGSIVDLE